MTRKRRRNPISEPVEADRLRDPGHGQAGPSVVRVVETAWRGLCAGVGVRADTLVMLARPQARRDAWLPREVLGALGADTSAGSGRNYAEAQFLATVRLADRVLSHLVVLGAADLKPGPLEDVISIGVAAGLTVWLVYTPGTVRRDDRALLAWTDALTDPGELVKLLRTEPEAHRAAPVQAELPLDARVRLPVSSLPEADWTTLLETVELRCPDALPAVTDRWSRQRDETRTLVINTSEENQEQVLLQHLQALADDAATAAELTLDLRAAQTGAFLAGWHVRVDLANLQAARSRRGAPGRRTCEMWQQLRCYPHPRRAAAAALLSASLNASQAAGVKVGDVDVDGRGVVLGAVLRRVEPGAEEHVRTQLLLRRAEGASDTEPLLVTSQGTPWKTRDVGDALKEVARDTGLLLAARGDGPRGTRGSRLYDVGLTVQRLGAPLSARPATPADVVPQHGVGDPDVAGSTLFDGALLARRRVELGISGRKLASDLGVSLGVLRSLEAGRNHDAISFALVKQLADGLGLTLDELVLGRPGGGVVAVDLDADAAALGAALFTAGRLTARTVLLDLLEWPAARLDEARAALATRMTGVGLRLVDRDGLLGLVAGLDVNAPGRMAVARARFAQDGMSVTVARLLRVAVAHAVGEGQALDPSGNAQRVAAGQLVNAGLLDVDWEPSPSVLRALGVTSKQGAHSGTAHSS